MKGAFWSVLAAALLVLSQPLRAETVAGSVVGPQGKPIAATVIFIPHGRWSATSKPMQTAPDGTFRFEVEQLKRAENVDSSQPIGDSASRGAVAAFAPGLSLSIALLKTGHANILKLSPSRKIAGVLRDDKGMPVVGAVVHVSQLFQHSGEARNAESLFFKAPPSLEKQMSAKTGADGAWEIAGVPTEGGVYVQLDDERYISSGAQYNAQGEISGPFSREMVARRAGSISGRVLNPKGLPSGGVEVLAQGRPEAGQRNIFGSFGYGKTDGAGVFRITRLAPGTYDLFIGRGMGRSPLFSPRPSTAVFVAAAIEEVRVEAGKAATGHRVQLVAAVKVKGRVFDRATGKPLSGISVGAYGKASPQSGGLRPSTQTDDQGRYELSLMPGANELYAYEDNLWGNDVPKELKTVPVMLQAGVGKTISLWVERRFADAQGQVVDETGRPAPSVEITLWNASGTGRTLYTDEKGNFLLKRLPPGSMRVEPRHQWSLVSPRNIVLPMAGSAPIKIVLRRNTMAKVMGRVVDATGKPLAGVKFRFTMPLIRDDMEGARSILSVVSDETGAYVFPELKMPDARQLVLESAVKKGYKLRVGNVVPPVTTAADTLQLADVVFDRLGRNIKGIVQDGAGRAIEGALVRASGDDYANIAVTDAAGRFTIGEQPDGEVDLMTAHNRSFGRARYADGEAKIVLQAGAALPPQDVARAAALFREMAATADTRALNGAVQALAPHDAATALQLLLAAPNARPEAARMQILRALTKESSDASFSWAQNELGQITDDADFIEAVARLGLLLAARQPAAAQALFEQTNVRLARLPADKISVATAWAAALASRLKLPVAQELVYRALASAGQKADVVLALLVPLSSGTAETAEQFLDTLRAQQEINIYRYQRAIEQVALYDATGAQRLLEKMRLLVDAVPELPNENGQLRGRAAHEHTWAFAAKAVLRALDRAEATTASAIARRVKGWHRPSALALAAEFGSRENRLIMARETVAAEERGDWMKNVTLPRLGALVSAEDAEMASRFFSQAAQTLDAQRRERGGETNASDWSFYAAFWNPAQGRLALEADWHRAQEKSRLMTEDKYNFVEWSKASLAMAMSSVDIDRALEWARQTSDKANPNSDSPRTRSLAFIGKLLLTEPAQRRRLVISPESGYDS